jgi:hypothetical protein
MPYDEPDPQDPMILVGLSPPSGPEAAAEMACAFADEFARMGYDEAQILSFFTRPFYAGAHGAYRQVGEGRIREIIAESVGVWGRLRLTDRDPVLPGAVRATEEKDDD